ncbi:MAG TPA: WbqC family protein [Puia sp.]|nr:WbqC family protein [Puia sp.]
MKLIIDSQYFAQFSYYKISYRFTNIVFEQYESWQKMSFRNRCRITGAEGVIDLSIPIVGGRDQRCLMKEVRVADDKRWRDRHWKTIASCYGRSPWFELYRDELADLYRRPVKFLLDWNLACFDWSTKVLGMAPAIALSDRYQKGYSGDEVLDWRGRIVPGRKRDEPVQPGDREAASVGGKAGYVEPGTVGGEGIGGEAGRVEPGTVGGEGIPPGRNGSDVGAGAPRYRQVFEERIGFVPDLSILDLLFCEGPNAIRYIQS